MARILVVDDRPANCALISYLLAYYGHDVTTASDGSEAVRLAINETPDLVVMDIEMPGIDGYHAAQLIRAQPELGSLPLVAVSATSGASHALAAAAGFDDFYALPIDPECFVGCVERHLRTDGADAARDATRSGVGRDPGASPAP